MINKMYVQDLRLKLCQLSYERTNDSQQNCFPLLEFRKLKEKLNFKTLSCKSTTFKFIHGFFLFLLQVEAGDVILRVNEVDVNRFSTKEGKFLI